MAWSSLFGFRQYVLRVNGEFKQNFTCNVFDRIHIEQRARTEASLYVPAGHVINTIAVAGHTVDVTTKPAV